MNHWHSQRFLNEGRDKHVSPEVLAHADAIAKSIKQANAAIPPIFTLRHLAHEVDVPYPFLRDVVARTRDFEPYAVFRLRKSTVGHRPDRFRFICAPHPHLLKTQRWIHEHILSKGMRHSASGAYHPDSRIVDTAKVHCGAKWMVKLDVTNFFESILEPRVYEVFQDFGYQPLVSFELARICTRVRFSGNPIRPKGRSYSIKSYTQNPFIGHLPQGAPTSPMLANLASYDLDEALTSMAKTFGINIKYTRYADDITFSTTDKAFSRENAMKLINQAYEELKSHGLWPNLSKTHIVTPSARKIVLGLLVDGKEPRLSREFKDALRMHIHFLNKPDIGPVGHAERRGFDTVIGLQHHVFGLAAFAIGIENNWGRARMAELRSVNWPTANMYFP